MVKNRQSGVSLVELTVVMGILGLMISIMVGTLNPILLYGRALDGQRKRDLNNVRYLLEEYYNDKGCYPTVATVTTLLSDPANCGAKIPGFSKSGNLPCDPVTKIPYIISVPSGVCPKKFKIFTKLDTVSDNIITRNWNATARSLVYGYRLPGIEVSGNRINFGLASFGETWNESI